MADTEYLRGLALSANELKSLTDWPDALVEDYLNIVDNLITITDLWDNVLKILTVLNIILGSGTASRLLATGVDTELVSVTNLAAWIAGTANQITITDDGDGTITISIPDSPTFITPTVADLSNMTHDHKSAAKGGDFAWADMTQAATQADVAASTAHTVADTGETCDRSDIDAKLNALGTEINKINDLIDKLQAANLMT